MSRPLLGDSAGFAVLTFVSAAIVALVAAIGVSIIAVALAASRGVTGQDELIAATSTLWAIMATILVSQIGMLTVVVFAWWCTGSPFRERIGITAPRVSVRDAVTLILAGGVPFALAIGVAMCLPSMGGADAVVAVWTDSSAIESIVWVVVIGLFPGVVEEMLFRGMIQRSFRRRYSPVVAILLTSFLFALLHIDPPAMGLAFTLGLWLGVVAWRTGSIVLTVLTHLIINSGWNVAQLVIRQHDIATTPILVVSLVLGAVSLLAFARSIRILGRIPPPPPVAA